MANPLTIDWLPETFRRPLMILAFSGWNDAAESATTAARFLSAAWNAQKFAEIDPEEFYHFGLSRPSVRFKTGSQTEREIVWPATEFSLTQSPDLPRDVLEAKVRKYLKKSMALEKFWREPVTGVPDVHPGLQGAEIRPAVGCCSAPWPGSSAAARAAPSS